MFGSMQLSAVLLLLIATQDAPVKPAWEWTVDERIAARSDVAARAERWSVARASGEIRGAVATDLVLGSRNPELVMPVELMQQVGLAFLPDRQERWRKQWAAGAEILGPDFWDRLEWVALPLFETMRRSAELGSRIAVATDIERHRLLEELQTVSAPECRQCAEALAAARAVFGREAFDRFLYQVVAPGTKFMIGSSSPATLELHWRWLEEGCPP